MMYAVSMSAPGEPVQGRNVSARGGRRSAPRIEDMGPVQRRRPRPHGGGGGGSDRRLGVAAVAAMLVFAVILLAVLHFFHTDSSTSTPAPARAAVVFLIDGVGPTDLAGSNFPVIRSLRNEGVTYTSAWSGILQPSVEAAYATLATGHVPGVHGILGPAWEDAKHQSISQALNPSQVLLGSLDQIMETANLTPVAAVLKARDRRAGTLSVAGSCAAASAAGTWAADYLVCPARHAGTWEPTSVAGHEAPAALGSDPSLHVAVSRGKRLAPSLQGWALGAQDNWITSCALRAMRLTHPALTVIDFPEIGNLLAWSPTSFRATLLHRLLAGIDHDIGRVLAYERSLHNASRTLYVVTSNGATAPAYARLPSATVRDAVVAAGGETTFVAGDSAVTVGLRDRLQTDPVAQALQSESLPGVDAVYVKQQNGNSSSYQLKYVKPNMPRGYRHTLDVLTSTAASPDSADLALILAPNTLLRSPPQAGFQPTSAAVGAQWFNQNIPLIITGPGTYQGIQSAFPARLVDIAPTVETLFHLPLQRSDGIPLADAMPQPPSGAVDAQRAASRSLRQLIVPLMRRSGLKIRG